MYRHCNVRIQIQLCAESGTSYASTDQDTDALWWSTHLEAARWKQSRCALERQVEDQTEKKMVTG